MQDILQQVADIDPVLGNAVDENRIVCIATGNAGPCIDLSRLDETLTLASEDCDLIVLIVASIIVCV